jgi:uncharacterized protein (TIGR03435 family)
MRKFWRLARSIPFAMASLSAIAQTTAALPVYDAVAIKPDKSGSGRMMFTTRDDAYQATNVTLKMLLAQAYGIREGLIAGLPPWADSAHFDIDAKIVEYDAATMKNLSREQQRAMLAALLVDRFHLKVHPEVKSLALYDLVIAKDGPRIEAAAPAAAASLRNQPPAPKDGPPAMGRGGISFRSSDAGWEVTADAIPLSNLATFLADRLEREVIDKTGLTGEYDVHLKWTPDNAPQPLPDDAPPNLFTALQEQLGLRLQPGKGPVKTLVVDHVEQPTEN